MKWIVVLLFALSSVACFETVESVCSLDEDCFVGETCVGGACVELQCPEDQQICDATCVDTENDPANCGGCGTSCEVVCSGGVCLNPTDLAVGGRHSCAVVGPRNQVACWGANDLGQLGQAAIGAGPSLVSDLEEVRAISAGLNFTCALNQSGLVSCWGSNSSGQLGRMSPSPGTGSFSPEVGTVRDLSAVSQIAAGERHACAITDGGENVKCWGSNRLRALGVESAEPFRATAGPIDSSELGDNDFEKIAAGRDFTCATAGQAQRLICWGADDAGQSLGDANTPVSPSENQFSMTEFSLGSGVGCGTLVEGQDVCWGRNTRGELGRGTLSENEEVGEIDSSIEFTSFALGLGEHACAIATDENVWCWGMNASSEAAPDSSTDTLPFPVETGVRATQIGVGVGFTCALDGDRISCWGDAAQGRLGPFDLTNESERPARSGSDQ